MPIKAAVMGLGNIGRYAIEALEIQPDFTCVGVIRRKESLGKDAHDLRGVPEYASLADLEAVSGKPDVVLLCAPSRKIPEVAGDLLGKGYNTVDSFDIHDRSRPRHCRRGRRHLDHHSSGRRAPFPPRLCGA